VAAECSTPIQPRLLRLRLWARKRQRRALSREPAARLPSSVPDVAQRRSLAAESCDDREELMMIPPAAMISGVCDGQVGEV
jgi:hypothetical protein